MEFASRSDVAFFLIMGDPCIGAHEVEFALTRGSPIRRSFFCLDSELNLPIEFNRKLIIPRQICIKIGFWDALKGYSHHATSVSDLVCASVALSVQFYGSADKQMCSLNSLGNEWK